jgi:hypothetical protein
MHGKWRVFSRSDCYTLSRPYLVVPSFLLAPLFVSLVVIIILEREVLLAAQRFPDSPCFISKCFFYPRYIHQSCIIRYWKGTHSHASRPDGVFWRLTCRLSDLWYRLGICIQGFFFSPWGALPLILIPPTRFAKERNNVHLLIGYICICNSVSQFKLHFTQLIHIQAIHTHCAISTQILQNTRSFLPVPLSHSQICTWHVQISGSPPSLYCSISRGATLLATAGATCRHSSHLTFYRTGYMGFVTARATLRVRAGHAHITHRTGERLLAVLANLIDSLGFGVWLCE